MSSNQSDTTDSTDQVTEGLVEAEADGGDDA